MRGTSILVLAMAAMGCGYMRPPAPAPRQSEAMARSARMLRQLNRLEADLHAADAENGTYAELVDRHGRAEQIACKVTDEHVSEITRLAAAQEQKIRQKKLERLSRKKSKAVAQLSPRNGRS